VSDTTTLTLSGNVTGTWSIRVRIQAWTSGATIEVNRQAQNIAVNPGSYATVTRAWAAGDTVTVRLPKRVIAQVGNDNANVVALLYRPAVLCGNYGDTALTALVVSSVNRVSSGSLAFTVTANGTTVNPGPFHGAHGFNYTVYWNAGGGTQEGIYELANVATGLVLGVRDMSTVDGELAVQWGDTGTADHQWAMVADGNGPVPQCPQWQSARRGERVHRRQRHS
jgi:hypothetical protein